MKIIIFLKNMKCSEKSFQEYNSQILIYLVIKLTLENNAIALFELQIWFVTNRKCFKVIQYTKPL